MHGGWGDRLCGGRSRLDDGSWPTADRTPLVMMDFCLQICRPALVADLVLRRLHAAVDRWEKLGFEILLPGTWEKRNRTPLSPAMMTAPCRPSPGLPHRVVAALEEDGFSPGCGDRT
ncbi:hypothetical protein ACLOJK_024195 [Asimina triloba]